MIKSCGVGSLKWTLLLLLACLSSNSYAKKRVYKHKEIWQELYLHHAPSENFSFGVLFNNFYSTSEGNNDWFVQGGVKYKIISNIHIEGLFRREYFKPVGDWTYENRFAIRISGQTHIGSWSIRNRHRIELRHYEKESRSYRYRTDIKVKPDWFFTKLKLKPYIQEEAFVNSKQVSRIRSYFGIQGKKGAFEPSVYFLIQSNNQGNYFKYLLIYGISVAVQL
jgi:hypothetical protein